MPNHVTNVIHAAPDVLDSLLRHRTVQELEQYVKYEDTRRQRLMERDGNDNAFTEKKLDPDDRIIDFNLMVQLPADDDPRITSTKTDYGNGIVGWSLDGNCPMDFARNLWGTKWNAYEQIVDDRTDRLEFDTAWDSPKPVFVALSLMHPEAEITVEYADEDFGNNLGHYMMRNGMVIDHVTGNYSEEDERNELAARILYGKTFAEVQEEWDED